MTSPLLALFIRSLREDSRAKRTYLSRAGIVIVTLLFLFTVQAQMGWSNAPGLSFFQTVAWINLAFIVLTGVSYFSAAIAEEKEEMTLGLLRMTNLNPLSILIGKSTSRLCQVALLFAAQIPFTLLAITLGGVSLNDIFCAYAALGAFLVLFSNLALLASVIFRRSGSAAVATGATLILVFWIFPLITTVIRWPVTLGWITDSSGWVRFCDRAAALVNRASPDTRLTTIFHTSFHGSAMCFQVASNLIAGLVLFLFAWGLFEVFCNEQRDTAVAGQNTVKKRSLRMLLRPGRVWPFALAWKDFHFIHRGKFFVLLKFAVYGLPLAILLTWPEKLGGPPSWRNFGNALFWFAIIVLFIELAFATAAIFRAERQGQTLSGLAILPQGIRWAAYQKLPGVLPSLIPVLTFIVWGASCDPGMVSDLWHSLSAQVRARPYQLFGYLLIPAQGLFFLHLVSNLSLRVKRGALPLAFGIQVLLLLFSGFPLSLIAQEHHPELLALLLTLGATAFLHYDIGRRLVRLAAEE